MATSKRCVLSLIFILKCLTKFNLIRMLEHMSTECLMKHNSRLVCLFVWSSRGTDYRRNKADILAGNCCHLVVMLADGNKLSKLNKQL